MQFAIEDIFSSIQRSANKIPAGTLSARLRFGEHKSDFRDQGYDFYQIREYDPERDSVSQIQWSSFDPDGTVYVREAKITKEFVVIVMADLSSSMAFSAGYPCKIRLLLETIGSIGLTCFHGQDPMGLIGFADNVIFDEPPRVGENNTYYLLEKLYDYFETMFKELSEGQPGRGTDFPEALDFFAKRYGNKRCFVVVVSDFIGCENLIDSPILQDITSQHEAVFLFLDDPNEFKIKSPWGFLRTRDVESGKIGTVSLRRFQQSGRITRMFRKRLREELGSAEVDSVVLEPGKIDRLARFFQTRQEKFRT